MGASPVVSSTPILQKDGYKVVGVIVLDVVEGEPVLSGDRGLG
jgi:protein phosphatase methylesterase 1